MMRLAKQFLMALLLAPQPIAALANEKPADQIATLDEAIGMFVFTCMSHFFSKDDLHPKLDSSPAAVKYSAEQAAPFLGKAAGEAWGIHGSSNNYVVALRPPTICSVNAERLPDNVEKDFTRLLEISFPQGKLEPVEEALAGPSTDLVKSLGYRVKTGDQLLPPIYTLVISKDPRLNFGARLTVWFPEGS